MPILSPADKVALEEGWKALVKIPLNEHEQIEQPFRCLNNTFQKGEYRETIWLWFNIMGFSVANRMNAIDPYNPEGVKPASMTDKDADAIVALAVTKIYFFLYVRGADCLAVTVKSDGVELNFIEFNKCLAVLQKYMEKGVSVKVQPWLLDTVRQVQADESPA
jgi:hypothetical protein